MAGHSNKRLRPSYWSKEVPIEFEDYKTLFMSPTLSIFWMHNPFKIWKYKSVVRCEPTSFSPFSTSIHGQSKVGFVSKTKSHLLLVTNPYTSAMFSYKEHMKYSEVSLLILGNFLLYRKFHCILNKLLFSSISWKD